MSLSVALAAGTSLDLDALGRPRTLSGYKVYQATVPVGVCQRWCAPPPAALPSSPPPPGSIP
eukprot:gene9804-8730_t